MFLNSTDISSKHAIATISLNLTNVLPLTAFSISLQQLLCLMKCAGRFHVHVLDYKSNLASLNELYERVKASNPQTELLVTLSPVPLGATFTGVDIVVANNYSKSTLRSVAADFCDGKEDVDYFPSFEAVTESAPNAAWMEDCIHVQLNLVQCVIGHFIKQYGYPALSEKVDMEKLLQTLADSPYVKES